MKIGVTRSIIDAIHDGSLVEEETETLPVFGLHVPKKCTNVPDELMIPKNSWKDKKEYDLQLNKLAGMFIKNFEKYSKDVSSSVLQAGPQI